MMRELSAISNRINQLAVKANALSLMDTRCSVREAKWHESARELWQKVHTQSDSSRIKIASKSVGDGNSPFDRDNSKVLRWQSSVIRTNTTRINKETAHIQRRGLLLYLYGRNKLERGHHCDYEASLKKRADIEPLVI